MRRIVLAIAIVIAFLAVTAQAEEQVPNPCKNPTPEQLQNEALREACRDIEEMDKAMENLRGVMQSLRSTMDRVQEADDRLQRQLRQMMPKRKERPGERIPSSPNELKR